MYICILHIDAFLRFRAVYRKADIYLLDDPLSAVDTAVGRLLFENCLCGLLKDSLVILVTHQLQYAKKADNVLVMSQVWTTKEHYTPLHTYK